MTKLRAGLTALLLALLSALLVVVPARADTSAPITQYDVQVNLTPKGVAEVTVNFTMDFGQVRGRGPILVFPTRQDDGKNPNEQYVFTYSDFSVSSPSGARDPSGSRSATRTSGMTAPSSTPSATRSPDSSSQTTPRATWTSSAGVSSARPGNHASRT